MQVGAARADLAVTVKGSASGSAPSASTVSGGDGSLTGWGGRR